MPTYNVRVLDYLLDQAGIAHSGSNMDGVVWDAGNSEIQARPDVAAVIATYVYQPTPLDVRLAAAKPNAGKVSELKGGITVNQAKTWLVRKVHGSDTQTALNASIDAAVADASLKVILKDIVATSYNRTETEKAILALLISIADTVMPDR